MRVKVKQKKRRTSKPFTTDIIGFKERDIIAAQKGNTKAWLRILNHFKPYIRIVVYSHRPGYTAQDYLERQKVAESALLEAVMKFKFRD